MKQLIAALIAGLAIPASACTARDSWRGPDKTQHAAIGAGISWIGTLHTGSPWQGFAWGVAAGAVKEALDATGAGTCSLQDFAVTALGAGVGAALGGVYVYHYRGTTVVAWSTRF